MMRTMMKIPLTVTLFLFFFFCGNLQAQTQPWIVSPEGNIHFNNGNYVNGDNRNVGIGTNNPSALFDVQSYKNDHWAAMIKNSGGSGNGLYVQAASGGANAVILQLRDNWLNVRMNVLSNGNVGIGTTSPDYKLDVVGTIRTHELLVNTQKGADFVFDSNYHLRPLKDVERFITANKHLPDIAPADSMVQNGVDVGEMQIKLLQKIEEPTLYVIEQEKRNKELQQQLEKQNDKIALQQSKIEKLENEISQ